MRFDRRGVCGASAATLLLFATGVLAEPAESQASQTPVRDFTLIDAQGQQPHELYKMAGDKAVVLVSTGVGCPIARAMTPVLKALRDKYAAKGVEVVMFDSNLQDGRDAIAAEAKEFGIDIPILMDKTQPSDAAR